MHFAAYYNPGKSVEIEAKVRLIRKICNLQLLRNSCVMVGCSQGSFLMRSVTATVFARNFAVIQHEVHKETVAVTSHSRVTGYFISPEDFAEFEELRAKARKNLVVGQLPPDTVAALQSVRMDSRHDALNALMED